MPVSAVRKPVDKIFNIGQVNKLTQIISRIDEEDAAERYEVEIEDNKVHRPDIDRAGGVDSPSPRKIIAWDDGDPENPYNWSNVRIQCSVCDQVLSCGSIHREKKQPLF